MKRMTALLAGLTLCASGSAGVANAAVLTASDHDGHPEVGEFMLYYGQNNGDGARTSSFHDFEYDTSDFRSFTFITNGKGAGQGVRNNAASAWNHKPGWVARVFYSPNYSGSIFQDIPAEKHINLNGNLRNNNASYKWFRA